MEEKEINVRMAVPGDLDFVNQHHCLPRAVVQRKILHEEIFLLIFDGEPVGQLRLAFLWSTIPYIELIHIESNFRKRGYSRILLGYLEEHLRRGGYDVLYSSSQVDEPEPQGWHRHMGFEACGLINGLNQGGIGEVFFRKAL